MGESSEIRPANYERETILERAAMMTPGLLVDCKAKTEGAEMTYLGTKNKWHGRLILIFSLRLQYIEEVESTGADMVCVFMVLSDYLSG